MKRLIAITGSILLVLIVISSFAPEKETGAVTHQESVYEEEPGTSSDQVTESAKEFCVREYNGRVAVFESGREKPIYISSTNVSILPKEDRKKLSEGIVTTDRKQLKRLIEDYCT